MHSTRVLCCLLSDAFLRVRSRFLSLLSCMLLLKSNGSNCKRRRDQPPSCQVCSSSLSFFLFVRHPVWWSFSPHERKPQFSLSLKTPTLSLLLFFLLLFPFLLPSLFFFRCFWLALIMSRTVSDASLHLSLH